MRAMFRIRVKVVGAGTPEDPFRVDLPTYMMISGTEEYVGVDKKVLKTVVVEIPDDEVDDKGRPSAEKIRGKYLGQKRWDQEDVAKDVVAK